MGFQSASCSFNSWLYPCRMRISRIYTSQNLTPSSEIELDGQQAHYLSKVLRLKVDAALILFNGDGCEYTAKIKHITKNRIQIEVLECSVKHTESPLHTSLGLGLSRGERMDTAIQKSTELGVSEITPLFTEFSEVKLQGERLQKKLQHWQQIAISACEQSGRTTVPSINPAIHLSKWCEELACPLKLIFEPSSENTLSSTSHVSEVALLIGPEGGFSKQELAVADKSGFQAVQLGPRVFRTETAPIAALTALQLLWGDFSI